jgi:hypothetical protein
LWNLSEFQQAWSAWVPGRYRQVEIRADHEVEPELPDRDEAISGFSGGVDSCFTAFRHSSRGDVCFRHRLTAAAMVHGFDIPLEDADGYRKAAIKVQRQLESLGLTLHRVATNYREQPVNWVFAFGAGLASVLSLFQSRFKFGLIAQGVPYHAYRSMVEGSNPLTDPLLSSASFNVVPDGPGYQRIDKIAALQAWPEGLRNPVRDENCCVCEKCIRNILSFRALGIDLPASFHRDVSDDQILKLVPIKPIMIDVGYGRILKLAEDRGAGGESWVAALNRAVRLSRRHHHLKGIRSLNRLLRFVRRTGLMG